MDFILGIVRRQWHLVAGLVLFAALSALAHTSVLHLLGQLVNTVAAERSRDFALFLAMVAGYVATATSSELFAAAVAALSLSVVRKAFVHTAARLPLSVIERVGPARVFGILTAEASSVSSAFMTFESFVFSILLCTLILGYIAHISIYLFLWTAIVLGGILAVSQTHLWDKKVADDISTARANMNHSFHELTEGAKELRLGNSRLDALLERSIWPNIDKERRLGLRFQASGAITRSISQSAILATVGAGVMVAQKLGISDRSVLTSYVIAAAGLSTPLTTAVAMTQAVLSVRASLSQVMEFESSLRDGSPPPPREPTPPLPREWGELRTLDLAYVHRDGQDRFELGPIDVAFEPGQVSFIVGGNGSGKSTLAKLLCGLYPPSGGEIWLDGEQVGEHNRAWLSSQFSAVFSDFFVSERLPETGDPERDARARDWLKRLGLDGKVTIKDGCFSTTALSLGQRKRLALIAAYLEDRAVYLFDEWAADQDPNFKRVFYSELLPELRSRGKCVIAITHDDRYFSLADQIIKLDRGTLSNEATGKFTSLLMGDAAPRS